MSAAIWKMASTFPPERPRPMTSATAACCAGPSNPEPKPATADAMRNAVRSVVSPITPVAAPVMSKPGMSRGGLRPPSVCEPTAECQGKGVAHSKNGQCQAAVSGADCRTATANSGMVAIRTPKVTQPLPKLENMAAR